MLIKCSSILVLVIWVNLPEQLMAQHAKWFGEQTINSIVLLEKRVGQRYVPHGTGFLLYNYRTKSNATIVTCAHLLKPKELYVVVRADTAFINVLNESAKSAVIFGNSRWNLDGPNLRLRVTLKRDSTYVAHDSLDIAAKTTMIARSTIRKRDKAHLGEEVYFVGFPFGIGTKYGAFLQGYLAQENPNPLVRSGSLAWLSDEKNEFLLDAFSYGGNSGSPIFTKVSLTKRGPFLIGMIFGHLGIENENFGLARCVWVDDILQVVDRAENLNN